MKKHVIMLMECVVKNANLGTKLHTALKYVTMEPMGIIVACHVGNAWIQRNVAMSMEHV